MFDSQHFDEEEAMQEFMYNEQRQKEIDKKVINSYKDLGLLPHATRVVDACHRVFYVLAEEYRRGIFAVRPDGRIEEVYKTEPVLPVFVEQTLDEVKQAWEAKLTHESHIRSMGETLGILKPIVPDDLTGFVD